MEVTGETHFDTKKQLSISTINNFVFVLSYSYSSSKSGDAKKDGGAKKTVEAKKDGGAKKADS